jgi:hypothetical protein
MYCNSSIGSGLRAMGLGFNVGRLAFNIDFQAEDGGARITCDELYYYLQDMRYQASKLVQGPSNSGHVSTLYEECILPLHKDFVAHLSASGKNSGGTAFEGRAWDVSMYPKYPKRSSASMHGTATAPPTGWF